ncbi:MAG: beta(1,3)galactosyltransferase EpsH [Candidatus Diapherotrites archaeon]|nr:beta(1,3)galactosyltransferase EpsH [Candidatus Diapherotrites archaeon]
MNRKIFIPVGTHPMQFNRLLGKIDELIESKKLGGNIFAQTGYSTYKPKHFKYSKFLDFGAFKQRMKNADLIITHGGEGVIGTALQLNKKMVIVPRLARFHEHTNDHQLELTRAVADSGNAIAVYDIAELENALEKINKIKLKRTAHAEGIMKIIEGFLNEE